MSATCARVQELAPELALGLLPGEERALVLGHLVGCDACRAVTARLAELADALLLAAPEAEPPAGFESRALARMGPPARSRRREVRAATLAAAVLLVVGIALGSLLPLGRRDGTEPVRTARLAVAGGGGAGEVYTYAGDPAWLFMVVRGVRDGTYTCRVRVRGGGQLAIGRLSVRDGRGAWGRALAVDPGLISTVELVDASGRVVARSRP